MQKNVLEYLEASARRCPDKTAFTDGARSFTYAQLLSCAKGLGTHLARTAPCLRRPVAVLIGRTAESIAAMQGVLYAGPAADAIAMVVAVVLTVRFFQQMNRQAKKA